MGRQDGNLGLQSKYGLKIHTIVISDAVMYKAAYENQLDVISDTQRWPFKSYILIVLDDDKGIFPPYYAAAYCSGRCFKEVS